MSPVAVITGGTRGIGYATCEYLASQGWSVGLCSRDKNEAEVVARAITEKFGVATFGYAADVANPEEVRQFAQRATHHLGSVTALVCNAAILGPVGRLVDVSFRDLADTFAVNVIGFTTCVQAFWENLISTDGFRIVTLAGGGLGGPGQMVRAPAYVPSKSALVSIVELISDEVTGAGGTVNVIAPGNIPTDFMKAVLEAGPILAGEVLFSQAAERTDREIGDSLQRYFDLLGFLLSDEASSISGRFLSARWNEPSSLSDLLAFNMSESLFRLRRIDNDLYLESSK
jgi:NAD(P)-dependent dehydrogenase (short-subunit alcohol dehydrogenase family)